MQARRAAPAPPRASTSTICTTTSATPHQLTPFVPACSVPPALLTWGDAAAWDDALRGVAATALRALGVTTPVQLELSALQIHSAETGTPPGVRAGGPDDGAWGALVLELPALHEGGTLELHHEGETLRLGQAGMAGARAAHWAAFYSSTGPQLTPVTSGRRLSLVYALRRTDGGPPLRPPSQAAAARRFERLARRWAADEDGDAPQKLVYFFEKQPALGADWDALEGTDRSVVEALLGAKLRGGGSAQDVREKPAIVRSSSEQLPCTHARCCRDRTARRPPSTSSSPPSPCTR